MKRLNSELLGIAAVGLALITCPAQTLADPYGFITCQTESNGLPFSASERDPGLARQMAVNSCTSDSRTNNDECNANLWCNDTSAYPPPMISCSTESNGLTFTHADRNESLARQLAISSCTSDSRTNNDECNANAACNDGYAPRPMVTCSTDSNGLNFTHSDRDPNLARQLALSSCTGDSRTNNDECNANLWCNNTSPYAPPMISCQTESNGLTFTHADRDVNLARQLAISSCTSDSRTNNAECQANIWCGNGGYNPPYPPQPVPPQPYPPQPVPPQPHPPLPVPPGPGHANPCFNRCAVGEMCTDSCPAHAVCSEINTAPPVWRVMSCG